MLGQVSVGVPWQKCLSIWKCSVRLNSFVNFSVSISVFILNYTLHMYVERFVFVLLAFRTNAAAIFVLLAAYKHCGCWFCFYWQVYTYKASRACLYWIVRLIKVTVVFLVLLAFFYCSYHIVLKYSVIYNLFLCYP